MKNTKLIIGLLFICSCAPVNNTTVSSPNINSSKSPSDLVTPLSPSPFNSIIPSVSPSTNQSPNALTTPVSLNSSSDSASTDFKDLSKISIISDTGQIMVEGTFDNGNFKSKSPNYDYTSLFNSRATFTAEVVHKDGSITKDGILWSISDPDIATIDQTGLVTAKNIKGNATIYLSFLNDKSKLLSFNMYVLDNLNESYTYNNLDCDNNTTTVTNTIIRQKYRYIASQPSGQTGSTPDISSGASFNGKVYDTNSVPIEGATVNARSIDNGVTWAGEAQLTTGGAYLFRNAPVGARLAITVTKDGWTTRTRSVVLKSNLQGCNSVNTFNFGGSGNVGDFVYSIQDEPEITLLKINGIEVTSAASGDGLQANGTIMKSIKPNSSQLSEENGSVSIPLSVGYLPGLTGVNNDTLDVEMTFSEPVRRDDVENNFRITSQSVFSSTANPRSNTNPFGNTESFIINQTYPSISFTWSADDRTVTFKTNKAVLANRDSREARYMIDFSEYGFRDKTDKRARDQRQFRFSDSQVNNYAVFSVKNDEVSPSLLSVAAREGGSSNDVLELRFSEMMDVINKSSQSSILSDPVSPLNTSNQLISRDTNLSNTTNNASLFGSLSPIISGDITTNKFFASYMIAKVSSGNLTNTDFKLSALGDSNKNYSTNASKINLASNINNDLILRSVRVSGSTVFLELSPNAFQKDDRIIVSAGDRISGQYNDTTRGITNKSLDVGLDISNNNVFDFATFVDPSGRSIDTGNETTSANFSVSNKQRVTTAQ